MINRAIDYMPVKPANEEAIDAGAVMAEARKYLRTCQRWVVDNPGSSLAGSFLLGVVLAWWIKRR